MHEIVRENKTLIYPIALIRYRWSKYFWCQFNIPFQCI
nr:MAG TPA: hypothetical protein [Caudoviricetes sp.]